MDCALKVTHYEDHVCFKAEDFPRRNISKLSQNCSQIFFLSDISVTGFVGSLELVQVLCKGNAML